MENWNCSGKKKVKIYSADTVLLLLHCSNLFGDSAKCVVSNCDIEKKVQSILSTWGPRTNLNWVKYNDDCIMSMHRICILLNTSCALFRF